MDKYQPELGQMAFGQPFKEYAVSELVEASLSAISDELCRVMWNLHQKEYSSPFSNTGNSFKNEVFEAHAYSWNDDVEQPFNFKFGDMEISWYKYLGRGMSANQVITPDACCAMLDACLQSIRAAEPKDY